MTKTPFRAAFGLALLVAATGAAHGETVHSRPATGVIELFTSQGCSSCPPADAAMSILVRQNDVVAVSYHVDYWNYRGWEDTLSDKRYSERQYGYAKTLGNGNVYTPQAVLNGQAEARASDPVAINAGLAELAKAGKGLLVDVSAELGPESLTIKVGPGQGDADVVIAYIREKATVAIERGENAGSTIDYAHAVVDLATVGMWSGQAGTFTLPAALVTKDGHDGCAIFLQTRDKAGNPGAILGAAILDDYE